jgi:apolipoprotein D and lipocalin family protein
MKSIFVTMALCAWALTAVANEAQPPKGGHNPEEALRTIQALDVPRYMGTWYEIAKYPNRFQKKCVSNTKADYQLLGDASVQVTNRCTTEGGEVDEAVGAARQTGDARSPRLEVRFAPAWLSFVPWVWGNYWVIDLDPAYQLVAVSEPKREYLWVLARTATVNPRAYEELLVRLEKQGFDTRKIVVTRQTN